jgi:RNA polymerase sigma factor (TIGR02999 family)
MAEGPGESVTKLLEAVSAGDRAAAERLLPLIYCDLYARAEKLMRRERRDHILQPTALVNEAYIRLVDQRVEHWKNRTQFLAVACEAMQRVLIDHARSRATKKRGGEIAKSDLPDIAGESPRWRPSHLESLAEAIEDLAAFNERQATVVKLRFFGGLSEEQTADYLKVSRRTVQNDWAHARAWLRWQLDSEVDHER